MSYYVTITRKPSPYWHSGEQISEAEWRNIALSHSDIRPPTELELAKVAPFGSESDLVWTGHPTHPVVWFDWYEGQIEVKNPDAIILTKMAALAKQLGAHLIGENGEVYDSRGVLLGVRELPNDPTDRRPSLFWRLAGKAVVYVLVTICLAGFGVLMFLMYRVLQMR